MEAEAAPFFIKKHNNWIKGALYNSKPGQRKKTCSEMLWSVVDIYFKNAAADFFDSQEFRSGKACRRFAKMAVILL
jgi:hypothetical protein